MTSLAEKLAGGDRHSLGRVNEVVSEVQAAPALFAPLFAALHAEDSVVRARAADAIEKLSHYHPEWLIPYRHQLLNEIAHSTQKELRWHVAQMVPRLRWSAAELPHVVALLRSYLTDESSIVKSCAMQALAELLPQAPSLTYEVMQQLQQLTISGTPAMQARGRKLLDSLTKR